MADHTLDEIGQALQAAHASGDEASATALAQQYATMSQPDHPGVVSSTLVRQQPTIYQMSTARDAALAAGDKDSADHLTGAINDRQATLKSGQADVNGPGSQVPSGLTEGDVLKAGAGVIQGAIDPILGTAALVRHLTPDIVANPVDSFGNYLSTKLPGIVAPSNGTQGVADINNKITSDYEAQRNATGGTGFDFSRLAGNVVSPANKLIPGVGGKPGAVADVVKQTLGTKVIQGLGQGAAAGAMQPVEGSQDGYWAQKGLQTGVGALTGGILAPVIPAIVTGAQKAAGAVTDALSSAPIIGKTVDYLSNLMGGGTKITADHVDNILNQEIQKAGGVPLASLPTDVQQSLRDTVGQALKTGDLTNPTQVGRLADLTANGLTPTRGMVTLNPVDVTLEKNAAKIAANSKDKSLHILPDLENTNNQALVNRINVLGADGSQTSNAMAEPVMNALAQTSAQSKARVGALYDAAKAVNGGDVTMDGAKFVNDAVAAAGQKAPFIPPEVQSVMKQVVDQQRAGQSLTVDQAEGLRTILSTAMRSSKDGNTRAAIGAVYDTLNKTVPDNLTGEAATAAYAAARSAHAAHMAAHEANPAMDAVVNGGAEPDNFVSKYVTGNGVTVNSLNNLKDAIAQNPDATQSVRTAILNKLKGGAVGNAPDDVAKFSPSGFRNALAQIGTDKLGVFFEPEEVQALKSLSRAANYAKDRPAGSAVNEANTGGLTEGLKTQAGDLFKFLGGYVPGGKPILQHAADRGSQKDATAAGRNVLNNLVDTNGANIPNNNNLLPFIPGVAGGTARPLGAN